MEQTGANKVDIIWGAHGQRSAVLPVAEVEAASEQAHLVLLD